MELPSIFNEIDFKFVEFVESLALSRIMSFPKDCKLPSFDSDEGYQKMSFFTTEIDINIPVASAQDVDSAIFRTIACNSLYAVTNTFTLESVIVSASNVVPERNLQDFATPTVYGDLGIKVKNITIPERVHIVVPKRNSCSLTVFWRQSPDTGKTWIRPFMCPISYDRQHESASSVMVRCV
jgi:hypothetical protein